MTDRSNLHLTGSAGWCQFRRIIAPFSSPFSSSSSSRLPSLPFSLPLDVYRPSRFSNAVLSRDASSACSLFSRITEFLRNQRFLQICIFSWVRRKWGESFWKALLLFEKISYRIAIASFRFSQSREKKYQNRWKGITIPRAEYRGSWHILSMPPHVRVFDTRRFTCSHVTLETRSSNTGARCASAHMGMLSRGRLVRTTWPNNRTILIGLFDVVVR